MTKALVKCNKCGREESVDFANSLRHGWPECHNETMTLINATPADVVAAVDKALDDDPGLQSIHAWFDPESE